MSLPRHIKIPDDYTIVKYQLITEPGSLGVIIALDFGAFGQEAEKPVIRLHSCDGHGGPPPFVSEDVIPILLTTLSFVGPDDFRLREKLNELIDIFCVHHPNSLKTVTPVTPTQQELHMRAF